MTSWRFVLQSLTHHWRINLAVALGVAAATAVLTGALLVGDSVRGSLRQLTLERLGRIDEVLIADRFFREDLAKELASSQGFDAHFSAAVPALLFPRGTVEPVQQTFEDPADSAGENAAEPDGNAAVPDGNAAVPDGNAAVPDRNAAVPDGNAAISEEPAGRAAGVLVVGTTPEFWQLGDELGRPAVLPGEQEIVLNAPLADELGVGVGDLVSLRLPKATQVPAESLLGDKRDRIRGVSQLKVVDVIPARGLGRFSLTSQQTSPRNAYVALSTLQRPLDQDGRVNCLLVAGKSANDWPTLAASEALDRMFRPTLEDYGFRLKHVEREFPAKDGETIFDYYSLSTDRMLFSPEAERLTVDAFQDRVSQPVLTYLANAISRVPTEAGNRPAAGGVPAAGDDSASSGKTNDAEAQDDADKAAVDKPVEIAYSTVAAIDEATAAELFRQMEGEPVALDDNGIVLNSWAADRLNATIGDTIRLAYFEPEATHGEYVETKADFVLRGIVPLTEPSRPYRRGREAVYDQRPTPVNDPDLTPEVAGVTDSDSIERWDVPFPMTRSIPTEDDRYWKNHRTTPKAFVSLERGQQLWGSQRFGEVTSFRIAASQPDGADQDAVDRASDAPATGDADSGDADSGDAADSGPGASGADAVELAEPDEGTALRQDFERTVRESGRHLGLVFQPLKRRALQASGGTTPFDGLFLGLGLFIIVAALMLVALLFRLGVEQRAGELGVLLAVGFRRRHASWLLVFEGTLVAALGGVLGVMAGVAYCWLMLIGLQRWWVGAIVTPFLEFHWSPLTVVIGYLLGVLVSAATIAVTVRSLRKVSNRRLLAGQAQEAGVPVRRRARGLVFVAVGLGVCAVVMALAALGVGGETQAGLFVGAGATLLIAMLLLVWIWLSGSSGGRAVIGSWPTVKLAGRSAGRNPGRSVLTIGLIAFASFLIVAMSSFRLSPTASGVGGFNLLAESGQPVFDNLNTEQGRRELFGDDRDKLSDVTILPFRVKPGDDASCNNLYRPTQPRILAVSADAIDYFDDPGVPGFAWAATAASTDEEAANPWRLLQSSEPDGPIPVILDKDTAMWSLRLYFGVGEEFDVVYDDGVQLRFRVVGLLSKSVLQGNLLIGDERFVREFPEAAGDRFFLIRTPPEDERAVAALLETRLGDEGLDVQSSYRILEGLLAVQNTYLSTFQSLGALGLLLGTFGLATVQLRSVLERRGELALLRTAGFRKRRLAAMVLLENVLLLLGGMAIGVLAALVAVLPHMLVGTAAIPWSLLTDLLLMLAVVLVVGLLSGMVAVRATLKAPLLEALRHE